MPASRLSFAVTRAYRGRVGIIRGVAQASSRTLWARLDGDDLDGSYERWLATMVSVLSASQSGAVNASAGYLTAFLASELLEPAAAARGDGGHVGVSRDGRPLREALRSPLIGAKAELKAGRSLERALQVGQTRAARLVALEVDHAARASLQDGLIAEDRIVGYRRAVRGTCGACLGAAAGTFDPADLFESHPGCQCYSEPVVRGVRDRFPRPDGAAIFAAMTVAEQDRAVGPEAAELVRTDAIVLADLVKLVRQKTTAPFLVQATGPGALK